MEHFIVSDLHLGAGDALEDFLVWGRRKNGPSAARRQAAIEALGREFFAFTSHCIAASAARGEMPHLLLLGDTFDLWQVRRAREKPAAALRRILVAHAHVVAGLRAVLGARGRLTVVIGNHDQPLVDGAVWGLLSEVLPGVNSLCGGGPVHWFADETSGLYAEHGHQWDPFNRIRALTRPDADCAGRRIVRVVVNRLEPMLPLLDKGATMGELLEELWRAGEGEGPILWREVAGHLTRIIGRAAGPVRAAHEQLRRYLSDEKTTPDFAKVSERELAVMDKALRRAIAPKPGGTTGPLPGNFRFLASGHTHQPLQATVESGGRAVTRLNPGTWRPVLVRDGKGRRVVRQTLSYIELSPASGEHRAALRYWRPGAR